VPEIKLTADSSDHEDTEGDRPVIVLLHGLLITGPLWNEVVDEPRLDHGCIRPTMPMGSHLRASAAASPRSPTVPGGLGAALKPRRLKAL
jgi:hypothetical protein